MTQTIVVGVTAADASHRAVEWAAQRAADRGDLLVLLSLVGTASTQEEETVAEAALSKTETHLAQQAQRARELGATTQTRAERGDPTRALIAASEQADLLVIGSDSRGRRSGVRGARGIRVTSGSHCPVVVVPDIEVAERAGVVVGLDGSTISEQALRFAVAEAERTGEPLTAVLTWSPVAVPLELRDYPEDYLVSMQKLSEETLAIALAGLAQDHPDIEVRRVVQSGRPETVLADLAETSRLLVVGSHGRGAIARFLLGSTTQSLLQEITAPTAVVR